MIENFLSGGAGIEPIAGALFAVGVMLLLVEAVGPGLGASGFLGAGCALASFLPDAAPARAVADGGPGRAGRRC